jgi:hypothetical protein
MESVIPTFTSIIQTCIYKVKKKLQQKNVNQISEYCEQNPRNNYGAAILK